MKCEGLESRGVKVLPLGFVLVTCGQVCVPPAGGAAVTPGLPRSSAPRFGA